ncbi:MAG: hypothetical protein AABZ47_09985, partial [Planctomycetota bacterium]
MSDSTLPFTIVSRVIDRRTIAFVASRNGNEIATEKYTAGDGNGRRKLANRWAGDERLTNGHRVSAKDVTAELERLELETFREMDRVSQEGANQDKNERPVASHVDDDVIVELAWSVEAGVPDFIVFHRIDATVTRESTVSIGKTTLVIPSSAAGIVSPGGRVSGAVFVPTEHDPSGENETILRADIAAFIHRYVELPDGAEEIGVNYILLTWLYDTFDELPYLAFRTADAGCGKSRALETIGTLCYRPLFVGGGSSSAATLRLLDTYAGTLVADEFDKSADTELGADLNKILNQGFQQRRPLVKCDGENNEPRPFRCFGPKLFAFRKGFGDDATESRTLSITMRPRTRNDVPINLPRADFDAEALELRNRLLAWRFANYVHNGRSGSRRN